MKKILLILLPFFIFAQSNHPAINTSLGGFSADLHNTNYAAIDNYLKEVDSLQNGYYTIPYNNQGFAINPGTTTIFSYSSGSGRITEFGFISITAIHIDSFDLEIICDGDTTVNMDLLTFFGAAGYNTLGQGIVHFGGLVHVLDADSANDDFAGASFYKMPFDSSLKINIENKTQTNSSCWVNMDVDLFGYQTGFDRGMYDHFYATSVTGNYSNGDTVEIATITGGGVVAGISVTLLNVTNFTIMENDFYYLPNGLSAETHWGYTSSHEDHFGGILYAWTADPAGRTYSFKQGSIYKSADHSVVFKNFMNYDAETGGKYFTDGMHVYWPLNDAGVTNADVTIVLYYYKDIR